MYRAVRLGQELLLFSACSGGVQVCVHAKRKTHATRARQFGRLPTYGRAHVHDLLFASYTALGPPAASNPDLRPCRARCGAVFPRSSPLLDPRDVPLHALAPERELASLDNLPATTTPPFQGRSPPFAWILSKSLRRRWTTWRDRTTPCQRARSLPRAWPSSVRVLYTGSVP